MQCAALRHGITAGDIKTEMQCTLLNIRQCADFQPDIRYPRNAVLFSLFADNVRRTEGFTKLAPSAVVIIGYGIAFYFLSLVLKSIPVGVAYAVWSGLGVVIITAIAWLLHGQKLDAWGFVGMGLIIAAFLLARSPSWKSLRADAMVTVFGILNLTEDSFFDESRRLRPRRRCHRGDRNAARVGSDVVDVGPAASHPDARPVSPADEIRRIAPLLDALSDQMHRVSIDSFQPETQRYALKRGVGYLNDIQGFPDPALYPDIAEADCRLVVMHSAQRDGMASPPAPVTFDPKTRSTRLCGSSRRGFPPCDGAGSLPTGSSSIRGWDFS